MKTLLVAVVLGLTVTSAMASASDGTPTGKKLDCRAIGGGLDHASSSTPTRAPGQITFQSIAPVTHDVFPSVESDNAELTMRFNYGPKTLVLSASYSRLWNGHQAPAGDGGVFLTVTTESGTTTVQWFESEATLGESGALIRVNPKAWSAMKLSAAPVNGEAFLLNCYLK